MKLLAVAVGLFVVVLATSSVSAQVWPYRVMIPAVMVDAALNGGSPTGTPTVTPTPMPTGTPVYVIITVILIPASDTPTSTVTPSITPTSTVTPTITPSPMPTAYGCTTPVTLFPASSIFWDTQPTQGNRVVMSYGLPAYFTVTPTGSTSYGNTYLIEIILGGGVPHYRAASQDLLAHTDYTRPAFSGNGGNIDISSATDQQAHLEAVYQFCQG